MHGRRQSVLVDICSLLGAAHDGAGGTMLVEGVAGIGKSVLLAEVRQIALDADAVVVTVAGSEAERDMPLAAVTQLCVPLLRTLEAIPAHQAQLVRIALGLVPPDRQVASGGNETMALGLALLSLLIEAGRQHGVVVLVDDAQWLDASSRQVFDFVARRLAGTPIALVAAQRPGDSGLRMSRAVSLDLLSTVDSLDLLTELGVERHVAGDIVERAPGLPLLLRRIAEGLTDQQRAGLAALPDPLPAGADLESGYASALERLDDEERGAVLLLAALGDHDLGTVDRSAAGRLQPAVVAGLLRRDELGVGFVNPIARSAAYWSATSTERRAAHLAIADSMGRRRPEEIWHRSAAADGPDEQLAGRLLEAGREIVRRGAAASSVVAFQRAAELSDDRRRRAAALIEGAAAAFTGGLHRVAELLLSQAESAGAEPDALLEVQTNLATVTGSPPRARRLLDRLAEARQATDPEAADAARVASAMVSLRMLDVASATESLERLGAHPSERVTRRAAVVATLIASRQSDPASAASLPARLRHIHQTDRAADDVRFLADAVTLALGSDRGGALLTLAGELHRDSGDVVPSIVPSLQLARAIQLSQSDLVGAAAAAQQAVDLAGELGLLALRALALPWLASMQAGLCDPQSITTCHAVQAAGGDLAMVTARLSLGHLHVGREEYDDAFAILLSLHDWSDGEVRTGMYWQADLAEAALRVGRRDVAEAQRATLERLATANGSPWLVGVHDRVVGQLCDDLDEAASHFDAAISHLQEHDLRIAAARASLMFGERLRRGRRRTAARERLLDARRTFDGAGMAAWVARCDRELAAAGVVVGTTDQPAHAVLSPQELQVARWVVAGESNREIAARLFLSPRTVEAHLSTIYRKLGTRGRSELIALGHRDASLVAAG